ncbi:MAG: sialidase family protein [Candidatus Latescibacteria bacterium]|jgi:hypothetical protein|nr:sialidase family protein [Candidatus Latescibacterota bacterium]
MSGIATVEKQVHVPYAGEQRAPTATVRYLGPGLRREERRSQEVASDWCDAFRVRTSEDNGRTWSEWEGFEGTGTTSNGMDWEQIPFAVCHDFVGGRTLRFLFLRHLFGSGAEAIQEHFRTGKQTMFDHNYWQMSADEGRTWSEPRQLCFEDGPVLSFGDTPTQEQLDANQMYGGYDAIPTREGTVIYPAAGTPHTLHDGGADEFVDAVRCFIGRWDESRSTYAWEVSEPVAVPHTVSGRGLAEPTIAQLADGRLFLEVRGSTVAIEPEWKGKTTSPGRRWFSISEDGGRTWSPVSDLRYDTGEQFYSPSTFSKLLRHSRTGKLYWVGNITPEPPEGNLPRRPLQIAEVDEAGPSLRKDTVTVVDDYNPDEDGPELQLSNFYLFEDRETGDLEMYMTRFGEDADHWLIANAYRYRIRPT